DGIRDRNVTGVQTCALPISMVARKRSRSRGATSPVPLGRVLPTGGAAASPFLGWPFPAGAGLGAGFFVVPGAEAGFAMSSNPCRSEERRVGKDWWVRGGAAR